MLIKNKSKLERKHPNFENEIGIISAIANGVCSIVNTDLVDFASSNMTDCSIDVQNFLLSSKPKQIECRNKENQLIFSLLFEKSGFCFAYHIYDSQLISLACDADVADQIMIFIIAGSTLIYNIDFKKNNEYSGTIVLTAQNGQPLLEKYTFEEKTNNR